jgi:ATP/maltotriose-dependent transcriptional regulator MalT
MSPVTPAGVLVGRESELDLLHDLLREAAKGRGKAVLVEGEPGIGKTTLVRAFLTKASELRCEVFWGVGDELGQEIPLAPFIEALRVREPSASIRRDMAAKLLRGELPADRGDTTALSEQLLALVAEQCEAQPTILVIDDIQWADPASVSLWGRLARMTENRPLLLLATMRPVPQREDLVKLRRVVGTEARVQLAALSEPAVAELVAHRAGGKPEADLLRVADDAGGNPLYLTELVDALVRGDRLTITDSGTAQLTGGSAPASLSAAIADRLDFVTGPVRETLRAAALLGVEFSVNDLATVLGQAVSDLIPVLEDGATAGVLAECGGDLKFRHPLIQHALYSSMTSALRAAWHRNAARALAASGASVDRVARQLLRAVNHPENSTAPANGTAHEEWVLEWLIASADQLVSQAPVVAAELLTQAIDEVSIDSNKYGWLASRRAHALFRIGELEQAQQAAKLALEYTKDPDLLVHLHSTLAQCLGVAGHAAEALATLNDALSSSGLSTQHRARLLVPAARTHVTLGQFNKADQVAADALIAATDANDNWAMGWALLVMASVSSIQGQLADALPLYDRALTVTQSEPTLTDLRLLLQINKASTLGNLNRYKEALQVAAQARRLADQVGTAIRLGQVHCLLSTLLFETGKWDDALTEVTVLTENVKEPATACCDFGTAAVISFHYGDAETARRFINTAIPYSERLGHRFVAQLALAQSMDLELAGHRPEALNALTSWFDDTEELGQIEEILVDAVRLAMATGRVETAKKFADHAATLASESRVPHRQANELYCRGLLKNDPHRLMAAAARFEDASRPLYRAKALEAASEAFIAIDDRAQARDAFSKACEVYESLGAEADVARLQAVFRRYNIRRGPHSKHRKAQSGWESLTPMEAKVAAFVEEGMSNPEIAGHLVLSPRTVGTHVSHILKKLNVSSRADIARESALRSLSSR